MKGRERNGLDRNGMDRDGGMKLDGYVVRKKKTR